MAVLVPLGLEHADAMQRLVADASVCAPLGLTRPYLPGGAEAHIQGCLREAREGRRASFAIDLGGCFVGACGLHSITDGVTAEVAFWLGAPYRGRGHGARAVAQLVRFAFDARELRALTARTLVVNRSACALLERHGFRPLRVARQRHAAWRRPVLVRTFALRRDDGVDA